MEDNLKSQWSELADTLGRTGLDILAGAPVTVTEKRFAEPSPALEAHTPCPTRRDVSRRAKIFSCSAALSPR